MARKLGIFKKVDLSDLADGWDGCYALVRPATYSLLKQLSEIDTDNITESAAADFNTKLVKDNLVGGMVKILGEEGELKSVELETEDVDQMSVEMVNHIMAEMTGQGAQYGDPKATATQPISEESPSTSKDSETQSSPD